MVSVIVPVYNVEKYLRQCLESIRNQTYKNIEVIIIDDGSKDSSGNICDEYAQKYDNFFVYHKINAGLGMARNTGLEHIKGEYVIFVDSDDYLDLTYIENLVKNMKLNNVDMCKGGFKRVDEIGKIKSIRVYDKRVFKKFEAKEVFLPYMIGSAPDKHDSIEMSVWGAIYNADIIKKQNIKFCSERELISEDLIFNIEYMQYADGACTIEEGGYNYRINRVSLTTSYRADKFNACKYFYITVKNRLMELQYDKSVILRLDRIFFLYIRGCMEQEIKKRSGENTHVCVNRIREICYDEMVQHIIKEYPKRKLGLSQKIFLYLIQYKLSFIIYILMEIRGWNK